MKQGHIIGEQEQPRNIENNEEVPDGGTVEGRHTGEDSLSI